MKGDQPPEKELVPAEYETARVYVKGSHHALSSRKLPTVN
jgi:hypothetical protein